MMSFDLSHVVVVDVESTCWEHGQTPVDERSEIIDIGVALLSMETMACAAGVSILVKPFYSSISAFCTELTGYAPDDFEHESVTDLYHACQRLKAQYYTHQRVWASWGDYDRIQFHRDCDAKGVRYPFGRRHINVKTLFALHQRLDKEVGMPKAVELLGMQLEGRHHTGRDDAHNIMRVLRFLLWGVKS